MEAAVLEAPGSLILKEVATPVCPPGGLLVRTRACSICSSDIRMFLRGHPALSYPRILGHEVAGIVIESRTGRFREGDRVQLFPGICCGECPACRRGADNQCKDIRIIGFSYDGGFARYLAVPAQSVVSGGVNLIPQGLSYEEALLAEPLASCLNGQQLANVTDGETVLILGGGPIGLLHAMLARVSGALRVLLAERLPSRLKMAEQAHADQIIDTSKNNLEAVVQAQTAGWGVDVILTACSEVELSPLPELLAPKGRLCLFSGLPPEKAKVRLDANLVHYRELKILGVYGSTAAQNSAALTLIASGRIPVAWLITRRLELAELKKGIQYVANREGLKAVIIFS